MKKLNRSKGHSSETTSPYKRVRLKRQISVYNYRLGKDVPLWVKVLYGGHWRRIKQCKTENEAIDVLCDIAERLRREQ